MQNVGLPLSAAYFDAAYLACLGAAIKDANALIHRCQIYASVAAPGDDATFSRHVAALSGGRPHDAPFLPRSPAGMAGGFSIHRAVRAPIARTDRQCACVCD